MKNNQVTCDFCEKDLTYATNCVDYRLVLKSEEKSHQGGADDLEGHAVTAMMLYPFLDSDAHFCGWRCLIGWLKDKKIV